MNISFSEKEFDQFVMLYLKDKIESIDDIAELNIDGTPNLFYVFVNELKNKAFWTMLNKVFLDAPVIQKVNTNRISKQKDKSSDSKIRVLM